MNNIERHYQQIADTKEQLKTATGYRKRDLQKYLKRLYKELKEYNRLINQ